jgi:hypothetical protein
MLRVSRQRCGLPEACAKAMTERRDQSPHNLMIRFWCDLYLERRHQKYYFTPRDAKTVKELREMVGDDEELRALMRGYLAMDDDWLEDKGKALHFLPSNIQKVVQFMRRPVKRVAPVSNEVASSMQEWRARKRAVNE